MNPKALIAGGAVVLGVAVLAVLVLGGDEPPAALPTPTPRDPNAGVADPAEAEPRGGPRPLDPSQPGPGSDPSRPDPRPGVDPGQPADPPPPGPRDGRPDPRVQPGEAPGALSVTLECFDEQGRPLPGVWIEPARSLPGRAPQPLEPVMSDAQGQAVVRPLGEGEVLEGVARHPLSTATQSFGPVHLRRSARIRLEFAREATGQLRGRIVDDQGAPVREAELVLTLARGGARDQEAAEAVLDGLAMGLNVNGEYLATAAAGAYAVAARGPGLAKSELVYLTVEAGREVEVPPLVVQRQGAVRGTVSLPPDLAQVQPLDLDVALEVTQRAETDTPYVRHDRRPLPLQGTSFELTGCDPGDYRMRLEVQRAGGNRVGPWVRFKLQPGQAVEGVTLVLREVSDGITGVVRDDRGYEVAGATVSALGRRVTSGARGEYALLGLDRGEVTLRAEADGHAAVSIRVNYGGGRSTHDLVLERLGGVRGEVRASGAPAARVVVHVCHRQGAIVRPHQVTTDAEGRFELEGLPPGSYFLKVGRGANALDDTGAPTLQIRPGELTQAPPLSAD